METRPVVLWLVGEPGVGKTTVARALLGRDVGGRNSGVLVLGKVKWTLRPTRCAAGSYTGADFDGADTLPLNGWKANAAYWRDAGLSRRALTILDGDRFSHPAAVEFFKEHATIVCVQLTSDAAYDRRAARAQRAGKVQNASWAKGRATKADNFASAFPGRCVTLCADVDPETLAAQIEGFLATLS